MFAKLWRRSRIRRKERRLEHQSGVDILDPRMRRRSKMHYYVSDHAVLRIFWTNYFEIAPGVHRSNQPTHGRFEKYARQGLRTVINLRGAEPYPHHLFEKETLDGLGVTLIDAKIWARMATRRNQLVKVIDSLRSAEKPLLFHCKSGADRAGLVAAIYLMVFENQPVEVARRQLGLKYVHLRFTRTGIQDYILDVYAARIAVAPVGFENWIRTEYDSKLVQRGFDRKTPAEQIAAQLSRDCHGSMAGDPETQTNEASR